MTAAAAAAAGGTGTGGGTRTATGTGTGTPTPVRVALLGCGNVGGALAEMLTAGANDITARTGVELELVGVAVKDPNKERPGVPGSLLTGDAKGLVERPDVELVVELIGGIDPARTLVESALRAGRPVVTGNKALLAECGAELAALAADSGVDLLYEAAVAGAIPVIRPLRQSLAGERIVRVMGIVNGTTNFILTQMDEEGSDYADALAEAQRLGLAERDPSADVGGDDAAAKAAILAELVDGGPAVSVRVHPTMVPREHPLASVRGAFNAVFIEGEAAGELMLYGRGAGGAPTASAVLGDVIDAARNLRSNSPAPAPRLESVPLHPLEDLRSAFYLSLDAFDRPGVLAAVAKVFGDHGVSIRAMEQVGLGEEARLIFLTHVAREGDVAATIEGLDALDAVDRVGGVLRVIGPDDGPDDGPAGPGGGS